MSRAWSVILTIGMLILSAIFLNWSGLLQSPRFPHIKSLILNRQGNHQLKAQNYSSALESYVKILEFDPFASEIHLDLGLTYEGQQQPEKAMSSYQNSLKYAMNNEMKFISLFNQAQLFGKDKKVDEALELYQKALAFDPTSKEVKTNIELLMQQQQQQKEDGQENKEKNQDQKDNKDNKDQKGQGKDEKDDKGKDEKDKQQFGQNQKYKPRPFKGQELSEGDVKKILGEIKQQEQKIRSEYNRKEVKEQPRDKDW